MYLTVIICSYLTVGSLSCRPCGCVSDPQEQADRSERDPCRMDSQRPQSKWGKIISPAHAIAHVLVLSLAHALALAP